jgi:hypothetical protein
MSDSACLDQEMPRASPRAEPADSPPSQSFLSFFSNLYVFTPWCALAPGSWLLAPCLPLCRFVPSDSE